MASAVTVLENYTSGIKRAINAGIQEIIQEEAEEASKRVQKRVLTLSGKFAIQMQQTFNSVNDKVEFHFSVKLPEDVKS